VLNRGKNYLKARDLKTKPEYSLEEAVALIKQSHYVKFDESVDIALRLGVNPKQSDQMVRGTVVLPHGSGGRGLRRWRGPDRKDRRRLGRFRHRHRHARHYAGRGQIGPHSGD
jgi:hypothetical protein